MAATSRHNALTTAKFFIEGLRMRFSCRTSEGTIVPQSPDRVTRFSGGDGGGEFGGVGALALHEPENDAPDEECGEDGSVDFGTELIFFHEPNVVDDAGRGRGVDEAVEDDPLLAETADPAFG